MELLKYQKKAVDEIMSHLQTKNKVIFVSGVGTGKTYVFLGVSEHFSGRILYILPKKAIQKNVEHNSAYQERELLRLIEVGASCFSHYCIGYDIT